MSNLGKGQFLFCFSHILSVFHCVFGNEGSKNQTKSDSLALLIRIGNNGYKQDKSAAQNSFNVHLEGGFCLVC